jgi:aspartyl-tRNA(Asn)/glutamyl-tRNA(Gln) amidotransferase subunit B
MEIRPIIGLEIHVQLATRTKLFCGCVLEFGAAPNTRVCPVCMGLPGALPVMNRSAYEFALRAGAALHCRIPAASKWDRKSYY